MIQTVRWIIQPIPFRLLHRVEHMLLAELGQPSEKSNLSIVAKAVTSAIRTSDEKQRRYDKKHTNKRKYSLAGLMQPAIAERQHIIHRPRRARLWRGKK
jgi:hypothetical protein